MSENSVVSQGRMKATDLPFNVEILDLSRERLRALRPVSATDIMESSGQKLGPVDQLKDGISWSGASNVSSNFHEDGLFSTTIFGRIGEDDRDTRFSYINIRVKVFHPLIHKALSKLKGLYKDIMAGKAYAVWDEEEKDFVASDEVEGDTGFQFFVKHWEKIDFKTTKSPTRSQRVAMINKYKDRAMVDKILVMPAGLRDVRVGDGGRLEHDEINDIYRRIVGISRTVGSASEGTTSPALNYSRHLLQEAFNEIYQTIEQMLTGKKGFIQNKWSSRRIFNGTRNVISSMDTSKDYLGGSDAPKNTDTILGLYQVMKGALPLTLNLLRNGFLGEAFGTGESSTTAKLVDKKTLKAETVELSSITKDRWTTIEGLGRVINSFQNPETRHNPIDIEGRWLGLIYKDDNYFKIFSDIDDLPESFSRDNVHPLSLVELLYLSGYQTWNTLKVLVTRYPVTGVGSCYPSDLYTKTTIVGAKKQELGPDWEPMGEEFTANEFPTRDPDAFVDSQIVSSVRLAGLGGDYDGDTCSANIVYSDQSIQEIKRLLHSRESYVDPKGGLRTSASLDTIELVLRNMTGD